MPDFRPPKHIERRYARSLRRVSEDIGDIIAAMAVNGRLDSLQFIEAMRRYSDMVAEWADEIIVPRFLLETDAANVRRWRQGESARINKALEQPLAEGVVAQQMDLLQAEQVKYIKSIPLDAAERVQKIIRQNINQTKRSDVAAEQILKSQKVSQSRATLIARTETAKAMSALTQARAMEVGSDAYIWRTMRDSDVRPSHAKADGTVYKWSNPPTLDGMTGNAGELPNCRCFPEPIIS